MTRGPFAGELRSEVGTLGTDGEARRGGGREGERRRRRRRRPRLREEKDKEKVKTRRMRRKEKDKEKDKAREGRSETSKQNYSDSSRERERTDQSSLFPAHHHQDPSTPTAEHPDQRVRCHTFASAPLSARSGRCLRVRERTRGGDMRAKYSQGEERIDIRMLRRAVEGEKEVT